MCCRPPRQDKPVLGIIGCMAERLKSRLFEEKAVDIIAGPDALRSVPGLVDLFCQVAPLRQASCLASRGRLPTDMSLSLSPMSCGVLWVDRLPAGAAGWHRAEPE